MITYLWIALGSALGGMARYGCSTLAAGWIGEKHPWTATLAINVIGSFIIGAFSALSGPGGRIAVSPDVRLFVMVGICGGYTTFSSFSLQTLNLMRGGQMAMAGVNIVGSVVLCLLAVWLGVFVAGGFSPVRAG